MLQTDLVNAETVARHYRVSTATVGRWVRLNLIPHIRISRRIVRFRLADIERAKARGEVTLCHAAE